MRKFWSSVFLAFPVREHAFALRMCQRISIFFYYQNLIYAIIFLITIHLIFLSTQYIQKNSTFDI